MSLLFFRSVLFCLLMMGLGYSAHTKSAGMSGSPLERGAGVCYSCIFNNTPLPPHGQRAPSQEGNFSISSTIRVVTFKNNLAKPHPLHVSTSDISYNAQDSKLEVICTVFADDFELAIQKQYNTKVDLLKPALHTDMDVLVKRYVNEHLAIKTGNMTTQLNYLGFEVDKEAINIYLESEKIPTPKKIDVEVSLLHNIFDDQINIVHMTVNGVRKSGKINYPDKKIEQVF
jgi:hypothetical protein